MVDSKQTNKLEHPCFQQPADGSIRAWRYLDLPKFIWMLENQKLFLASLDSMSDPHEGSTPKIQADLQDQSRLAFHRHRMVSDFGEDLGSKRFQTELPKILDQIRRGRAEKQKWRKQLFANCWYLGDLESEAMWRLYCPGNGGVAIQTSYDKLVASVSSDPELYVGRVSYIDYDSQGFPEGNLFYPVMHKRMSFAHEQEARLVKIKIADNLGLPEEFYHSGIAIDWPLEPTVDAIFVDPYAPEYFYEVVCAVVRRFAPELADRVFWSRMKAAPVF
jgi:hypothetical protein